LEKDWNILGGFQSNINLPGLLWAASHCSGALMPKTTSPAPRRPARWLPLAALAVVLAIALPAGGLLYAAHLENNNAFCASCHTQPETQYFQRIGAGAPVDLASIHAAKNVSCIDCHSGAGATGRVLAMTSVAAPDLVAYLSGHYRNPAIVTVAIGDDHCLKCHADVSARRDMNNHFHFFLPQWQARAKDAATCIDCHQSHTTGGLTNASFLDQAHTVAVCQRCHTFAGVGG
jgi:nitrate/TMAO reductase-like tetraheme cytochrome c subunit